MARLASKSQINTSKVSPIVRAVVTASSYPLDVAHLAHLSIQPGVDGLAPRHVTLLPMNWVIVHHLQVFLQWMMHEGNTIVFVNVVCRHVATSFFVPLNLIPTDAVLSWPAQTCRTTRAEEPSSRHRHSWIGVALYVNNVGKLVEHVYAEVFE